MKAVVPISAAKVQTILAANLIPPGPGFQPIEVELGMAVTELTQNFFRCNVLSVIECNADNNIIMVPFVTGCNLAIEAKADDFTMNEDQPGGLNGDVLADNGNGADNDPQGDNLTVTPQGHLLVCEDAYTDTVDNHLRGVTPNGELYNFARLRTQTEPAGACFSPDGNILFVNASEQKKIH